MFDSLTDAASELITLGLGRSSASLWLPRHEGSVSPSSEANAGNRAALSRVRYHSEKHYENREQAKMLTT